MARRMFLVYLLVLSSPWIFEVKVEAQKQVKTCTQEEEGRVNGSLIISQRNEICRIVTNYSTIEVCENGEWREICDATFTQEDAQVICRQLEFSALRATAGYLRQRAGSFTTHFSPECNGQEASISDCHHIPLSNSEECPYSKIYVTCFKEDPVPGPLCNTVSAGPTYASTNTPVNKLPPATSVASPSHTTTDTDSTDPTNRGTTLSTNVGAPSSGPLSTTYTIIINAVCIVAVLFLFMAVTCAVVKYKKYRKYSTTSVHFKKHDPDESVLYSEVMDVPMEHRQQESCPVYETIKTVSVNTARMPATDACSVDLEENIAHETHLNPMNLQENIAYEASPADLKENIAYETRLNPVNLKKNIAYEMRINVDS